jgi:hypothetical protein
MTLYHLLTLQPPSLWLPHQKLVKTIAWLWEFLCFEAHQHAAAVFSFTVMNMQTPSWRNTQHIDMSLVLLAAVFLCAAAAAIRFAVQPLAGHL